MRRLAAMILVLSLVLVARRLGGDGGGRFATMALGFILVVAALVGESLEHLKLPRLTGYLLVGLIVGPSVLNVVTPAMTSQLRLINGIAVALIAFRAGMEVDLAAMRGRWATLLTHSGLLIALLYVGLFLTALAATPWLPFTAHQGWNIRIAAAVLLAAVMTTFSPTVVMAVLAETRARGPFAERVLQLVIIGDVGVVLLFTAATGVAHSLDGGTQAGGGIQHVAWEIFGSIGIGLLVGVGLHAYRKLVNQRTDLVLALTCLVVAEVGSRIGLSPLLCCLTAGFVTRTASKDAVHDMEALINVLLLPVLVVFFAAAGASLHLDQFAMVAPVAIGLVLVRTGLIVGSNRIAARVALLPDQVANSVPLGLVSQAGISLGLAVIVGRDFSSWGSMLETICVSTIAVHELVGPILFRAALQRHGEIPEVAVAEERRDEVEVGAAAH